MKYEKPAIVDFGSISEHTFTTPGGHSKDWKSCQLDPMFGENSCSD